MFSELFTDLVLFLTYAAVAFGGVWLYANRVCYRRWFYLVFALAFTCLALGVWPGYQVMSLLGYILVIVTAAAQILTNVLIEAHDKHDIDLRQGIDRRSERMIANL